MHQKVPGPPARDTDLRFEKSSAPKKYTTSKFSSPSSFRRSSYTVPVNV